MGIFHIVPLGGNRAVTRALLATTISAIGLGLGVSASNAQETPKSGGTVVVALGAEPTGINPTVTTNDPDVYTGCLVYDALVRINNKFEVEPSLAKSWTISEDGLTYTFELEDAKWSDGQPVTSTDVKFSLEEAGGKFGGRFAAASNAIDVIEATAPQVVTIKLKQNFGPMLFSLACDNNAAILPAHVFEGSEIPGNPANANPTVTSGPFKMESWARGDHIVFVKNPDYWKEGRPYLDRLIVKLMPDSSARILALQAGEIDHIHQYYFPMSSYNVFARDPRFAMEEGNFPGLDLALLNTQKAPLDNVKVRQALMTATDREYILKTVFFNTGQVAQSAFDTRIAWSYNPDVKFDELYPFDPEKAKAMLDEAGFPAGSDGKRFTLKLVFDTVRPELIAWAQALRQQWLAVGVDLQLEGAERAVVLNRVFNQYDFDVSLQNYTTAGDPALGIARAYVSSSINNAGAFNNASRYSNPDVDRLFDAGRDAATPEERADAYFELQTILAEELPVLPMHQRASIHASIKELKGFSLGGGYPWWADAWLDK